MKTLILSALFYLHRLIIGNNRINRLSELIASLLPDNANVLDIGSGNGKLACKIKKLRPDISIIGIDVLKYKNTEIKVKIFNGKKIPFPDKKFCCVLLVDVIHHLSEIEVLLSEAKRVSSKFIIIKDHCPQTKLDLFVLKIMDWIGNRPNGISLPYIYLNDEKWDNLWKKTKLKKDKEVNTINLYPIYLEYFNNLNFAVRLKK